MRTGNGSASAYSSFYFVTKKTIVTAGECGIIRRFAFMWETFKYGHCREKKRI